MLSPEASRSLVHRLASSRSQGWVMRSNRSRARGQSQAWSGGAGTGIFPTLQGALDLQLQINCPVH